MGKSLMLLCGLSLYLATEGWLSSLGVEFWTRCGIMATCATAAIMTWNAVPMRD